MMNFKLSNKGLSRLVLSMALGAALMSASALAGVKVDKAAPDFQLVNVDNETINLSDYKGKYVVLEWTNHLCPYVKKHYSSDNMQGLQKKFTDQEVVWLSIISSAPGKQGYVDSDTAKSLTSDRGAAPSEVLFDPEGTVGKMYGAKTTPHMYIIDPEGQLRYAGAIDSIKSANPADIPKATNYVDAGFGELFAGSEVTNKSTAPYGCSIKYKS